jgi:hypothetical protein
LWRRSQVLVTFAMQNNVPLAYLAFWIAPFGPFIM